MNMKNFTKWLNELEGFSLRKERLYDDLVANSKILPEEKDIQWNRLIVWLEAAYKVGYEAGKNK